MKGRTWVAVVAMLALSVGLAWSQPGASGKPAPGTSGNGPAPGVWDGPGARGGMAPGAGMSWRDHAGRWGRMRPTGRAAMRLARALDLTDAQRQRMADIRDRAARQNVQTRADLALARLDLRKLMRAERPDARAIDEQIDRMARLRATLQKTRVGALLEARGVLTPEQLQKLHTLRQRGGPGMGWGLEPDEGDEGLGS